MGFSGFEALTTGVAQLDANRVIVHANTAFSEHTGFRRSQITGKRLSGFPPEGPRLDALAARALDGTAGVAFHGVHLCAAPGRDVRIDGTLSPHANGVLLELHPAPLSADAPRVSESLRGFAHEIRNPLAAISGAAQLLAKRATDAGQRELIGLIESETTRLATLSERLLGARSTLATRALNVHAVLERAAELAAAQAAGVMVVRDYDPSLPAWQGDPDRLLQALLNLVRNAIEAGATRVVLRSRAEAGWRSADGQRVPALRIEVEDDGAGVPEAIAATLFEPMVSGHAGGSGLGLALAREVAREHGGELTFQPCPHGARFVLWLPRRMPPGADT